MKLRKLWIPILLVAGFCVIAGGCQKKVDLTETETLGVMKDSIKKSNITTQIIETTTATQTSAKESSSSSKNTIEAITKTYQNNKANISYPEISNLKDEKQTAQVNERIQKNVSSVIEAMKLDTATTKMDVKEEISSSSKKRISIVYTGTLTLPDGKKKNVFFTNNIDTTTGKDIGLSDFVDPQTMAGYILSNDVKLYNASAEVTKKFMDTRHNTSYEEYVAILTNSDFPFHTDAEGKVTSFPQSFSYEKNGTIYFSIPVSADMGDYVVVVYSPDSK